MNYNVNYDMTSGDRKDQKKDNKKPKASVVPPSSSHPEAPPRPNKGSKKP